MRFGLSVGHGKKADGGDDPGAVHPEIGVREHQTCARIGRILGMFLDEYRDIQPVIPPAGMPLTRRVEFLNDNHGREPIDLAVELHMNAFTQRTVDGCECLYFPASNVGRVWAEKLQSYLVDQLQATDRGAKAFGDDEWETHRNYFVRSTRMPAVIVEPAFITNDERAQQIITGDFVHQVAWALFRALIT